MRRVTYRTPRIGVTSSALVDSLRRVLASSRVSLVHVSMTRPVHTRALTRRLALVLSCAVSLGPEPGFWSRSQPVQDGEPIAGPRRANAGRPRAHRRTADGLLQRSARAVITWQPGPARLPREPRPRVMMTTVAVNAVQEMGPTSGCPHLCSCTITETWSAVYAECE